MPTMEEEQQNVISFLERPESFPGARAVQRIDTQLSIVFLAGSRAYKLKRALRTDLVDYSTLEKRRAACEAELRINRRYAPRLYRGRPVVTREKKGGLRLNGAGRPVEYLVEMVRFDPSDLLVHRLERGELTEALALALGERVADLHERAEVAAGPGAGPRMRDLVDLEIGQFLASAEDLFRDASVPDLCPRLRAAFDLETGRLEARGLDGYVRHCHGDLHLGNICLFDGRPTPFDAIEFNAALTTIDVLYDLAFLVMDLKHRHQDDLAECLLQRYVDRTGDRSGLPLMPLFVALRALVRSRVSAVTAGNTPDGEVAQVLREEALSYRCDAVRALRLAETGSEAAPRPPSLPGRAR